MTLKQGNLFEGTDDYEMFVKKFEPKKTTDDCYTPPIVYDAIADWVADEYKLSRENFVRPFYPGNDYKEIEYKDTDVVVDNPPFSILSEIINFYTTEKIHFFLFAPHLTLFSSGASTKHTCIPVGVQVIYENGANVCTSFITDLEDHDIIARTHPSLYKAVRIADDKNQAQKKAQLPIYCYPKNIITTPSFHKLSRYGLDFVVRRSEGVVCDKLDSQRDYGKTIFGRGLMLSDYKAAEREAAEREAAEREAAEREAAEREAAERRKVWTLSDREKLMIEHLNKQHKEEAK